MQEIHVLSGGDSDLFEDMGLSLKFSAVFRCEMCGEQFPSASSLRDHMVAEYGIEPELQDFLDISLGIDSFSEPGTPGSVDSASTVATELDRPSVVLQCPKCKKECRNYKGLRQHLAKIHQNRKKPVSCEECGKGFKHKHALKFHIRQVHEKATRVTCDRCGKAVYNKYMLKKHSLTCNGTA